MKLTDLSNYNTVILYGMGLNGKSVLNRIRGYVPNIICWDRNPGSYSGCEVTRPPVDFSDLANFGKYIIIITPTISEYTAEMVDNIPSECNVATLYSFEEYEDGFQTGGNGSVAERGYCPCCENDVSFEKHTTRKTLKGIGLVDLCHTRCPNCNSIERERATVDALNTFFPDWRDKTIHESSPTPLRIKTMQSLFAHSGDYSYSYFYEDVPLGSNRGEARCENLESLTFEDGSIDYFITTDVFEHINRPFSAFAEINRVLKKGGAHVFTVPYLRAVKTRFRVQERNGRLIYVDKPIYHGNPISDEGSLATVDWGYDIGKYIYDASGMVLLEYNCYKPIGCDGQEKTFIAVKGGAI